MDAIKGYKYRIYFFTLPVINRIKPGVFFYFQTDIGEKLSYQTWKPRKNGSKEIESNVRLLLKSLDRRSHLMSRSTWTESFVFQVRTCFNFQFLQQQLSENQSRNRKINKTRLSPWHRLLFLKLIMQNPIPKSLVNSRPSFYDV